MSVRPPAQHLAIEQSPVPDPAIAPDQYVISVRALCEFAARAGDLDRRFTPSTSAEQGIEGHRLVTARRGGSRRAELWLKYACGPLLVRGRADGFDQAAGIIEEVKTCRGPVEHLPPNQRALHRAQARVYAAMLCHQLEWDRITVRLTYLDVDSLRESMIDEVCSAIDLEDEFRRLRECFVGWARLDLAHRRLRNQALYRLRFAHEDFRIGQRMLAESTYRAVRGGGCLMAQACTGSGKTLGTLFPTLKAMPKAGIDKIYYLTAKGSGQASPLDALATLGAGTSLPLRIVRLVAREHACERPGTACHGDACDLAKGFYDRLPAARQEAVAASVPGVLDSRQVAARHAVCPYYLAQELVRWADIVVADYNYFFDGRALLAALAAANEWKVAVLVDEAHNLVERARSMYSAELRICGLERATQAAPAPVGAALKRLRNAWILQAATMASPAEPNALLAPLQDACDAIDRELAARAQGAAAATDPLVESYFELRAFVRLVEAFGPHSLFESRSGADAMLRIRNVVPAPFVGPRFGRVHSAVLFSGTLSPCRYEIDLLGLPSDTLFVEADPPFRPTQLTLEHARISTHYADRRDSVGPIADLIASQFRAQPGNYLAFFSSFAYLDAVQDELARSHPAIPSWRQQRPMSAFDRQQFLDRLQPGGTGVGFAVLGGSFAEGVDLPGSRLTGAFIATLGLPVVDAGNEAVRERIEALFGHGFDYAYLIPGLRKVVQAAGRVVRTPSDRGVIYLIDPRYDRRAVKALLPGWWPPLQAGGKTGAQPAAVRSNRPGVTT
jgi:Rad3-related DNA helicase